MMALRHLAILISLAAVVFFTNLGGPRLWDRDEPRNAGCARDMLAGGDWVVPTFNGEVREHKPVLTYWLMMTAYAAFDDPEFAPRFWPALLGAGTVVLVYATGRRLFNPAAGLWAGVVLATSVLFAVAARAATHDSVLAFTTTAALCLYVHLAFRRKEPAVDTVETLPADPDGRYYPRSWAAVALVGAAMGLVTLAKGPVPWVVSTAAMGMFLLVIRRNGDPAPHGPVARLKAWFDPRHVAATAWSMRPLTMLAAAVLVAGPWFVLVHLRTDGQFTHGFFVGHNLRRAATAMEGHGADALWKYPFYALFYYPLTLLAGTFPWSILAGGVVVATAHWIRRRDPWRAGFILVVCWVAVWVVAFSIPRTKLPTYMTPVFPAVALLVGAYVHRWTKGRAFPGFLEHKPAFAILIGIGAAALIGLLGFGHLIMPGIRPLGLIGLVPLVGGAVALTFANQGKLRRSAVALATVACVFATVALGFGAQVVSWQQRNGELLAAIRARSASPRVASYARLEPTWVYYLGQPIREIPREGIADAVAFLAGGRDRFLITTTGRADRLKPDLPPEVVVLAQVPYFGRDDDDLVVLGRK